MIIDYRERNPLHGSIAERQVPAEALTMLERALIVIDRIGFYEDWKDNSNAFYVALLQRLKTEADSLHEACDDSGQHPDFNQG